MLKSVLHQKSTAESVSGILPFARVVGCHADIFFQIKPFSCLQGNNSEMILNDCCKARGQQDHMMMVIPRKEIPLDDF